VFDKYLDDRQREPVPRWRRRLPLWLAIAGAVFVLFAWPLAPAYVLVASFYFGGRSARVRRWVIGNGEVPRVMVAGHSLLMLAVTATLLFEVRPTESSDDAWIVMFLPAGWLGVTALPLMAASVLPRHSQREWLLVSSMASYVALGVLAVLVLVATAIVSDERDMLDQAFREPVALAAAISLAMLLVVPLSVRRMATRDY
jgi:cobalamin synthase